MRNIFIGFLASWLMSAIASPRDDMLAAFARSDYKAGVSIGLPVAMKGDPVAQTLMGISYELGQGVNKDSAEAVKWYRRAALQGNSEAQYRFWNLEPPAEGSEAIKFLHRAGLNGHVKAQLKLGFLYLNGFTVKQDQNESIKWYERAAKQGNSEGQRTMALFLDKFNFPEAAAKYYLLAAEQGDDKAQTSLAFMYAQGRGVERDLATAVSLWKLAAIKNNDTAMFNLGIAFRNGTGVIKDLAKSVDWFRLAAEQGNVDSFEQLGVSYTSGVGVLQDSVQAHMWFNLAASKGAARASIVLDSMSAKMTPKQIEQAQNMAKTCLNNSYKNCF